MRVFLFCILVLSSSLLALCSEAPDELARRRAPWHEEYLGSFHRSYTKPAMAVDVWDVGALGAETMRPSSIVLRDPKADVEGTLHRVEDPYYFETHHILPGIVSADMPTGGHLRVEFNLFRDSCSYFDVSWDPEANYEVVFWEEYGPHYVGRRDYSARAVVKDRRPGHLRLHGPPPEILHNETLRERMDYYYGNEWQWMMYNPIIHVDVLCPHQPCHVNLTTSTINFKFHEKMVRNPSFVHKYGLEMVGVIALIGVGYVLIFERQPIPPRRHRR